jgi:hypothetical protein
MIAKFACFRSNLYNMYKTSSLFGCLGSLLHNWIAVKIAYGLQGLGRIFCQRPHQGAILENNVPFQIGNGPQLWLVKLWLFKLTTIDCAYDRLFSGLKDIHFFLIHTIFTYKNDNKSLWAQAAPILEWLFNVLAIAFLWGI